MVKAYNLGNNKAHQLPGGTLLLAPLPLALIIAITILKSKWPPLRSLLALPFSNFYFFIILNYYKTILIILLTAQLKNIIIIIIIKIVKILQIKVKLKTIIIKVTTAAIRIIMTLKTVIVVIVIGVIRYRGVQGDCYGLYLLSVTTTQSGARGVSGRDTGHDGTYRAM